MSFSDRLTTPLPGFRDVWKMMRERGPSRDLAGALSGAGAIPRGGSDGDGLGEDAAALPVAAAAGPLPATEPGATAVTWVGHATFVLRIGGLTVLTDPVWSRKIPAVAPRLTPAGVAWDALPPVDAVVISHNHYDHLDAPTIRRLSRDTPVLVPAKLGRCDFVPAHHWSRRTLTDTCRTLWGGWILASDTASVYFAGDTGYGHWFGEIGARYPGIDLALLPIGAYEPQWFMQPMHLNPEEAVQACREVGAPRMATMHWGTFILSGERVTEPPERAAKAWAESGRPREHLWDLAVGETRTL